MPTNFWTFSQKKKIGCFSQHSMPNLTILQNFLYKQMSFSVNKSDCPNKYSLLYLLPLGKQTNKTPEF